MQVTILLCCHPNFIRPLFSRKLSSSTKIPGTVQQYNPPASFHHPSGDAKGRDQVGRMLFTKVSFGHVTQDSDDEGLDA